LLGSWYLLVLAMIPGACYNYKKFSGILPTYNAKTTLLIKTQEVAKENLVTTQIFSEVANSRQVIENALLRSVTIYEVEDLLINHYIQTYQSTYPKTFNTYIPLGYRFDKTQPEDFSREELQYFDFILDKVTMPLRDFSDGFVTISNKDKLGFINLNISTPSQELSLAFMEILFTTLKDLYNKSIIHADRIALDGLRVKRDSVKRLFDKSFTTLLSRRDYFEKKLKARDTTVDLSRLAKRIQKREMNTELLKNEYLGYTKRVKDAEVDLSNKIPLIYITEQSRWPLEPYQPSVKYAMFKGAFYGAFLMVILLVMRQIYRDILTESEVESLLEPSASEL
ncbi:MAG: hypothetical protein AAGG75_00005, partial [Bacteroidota bacterium]